MKENDVFGIGNPLIDMLIKVDDKVLDKLKLKKGTLHLINKEQELKDILEKIKELKIKVSPGDSTANTLAGIALLGGKTIFVGKTGDDKHGIYYEKTLTKSNVESSLKKNKGLTGKCITFITSDSERTFVVYLGACLNLKKEDLIEKEITDSKFLHLTGYQLEDPNLREMSIHAMKIAKENKTKISIDLADPELIQRNLKDLKQITKKYADIIYLNEKEAKSFTGKEPETAVNKLNDYADIAIVKLGKEGSLINDNGRIIMIAGIKANAVDTTGAGDMYSACILYGLCNNWDLEKAGNLASKLAAKVVEQIGARLSEKIEP